MFGITKQYLGVLALRFIVQPELTSDKFYEVSQGDLVEQGIGQNGDLGYFVVTKNSLGSFLLSNPYPNQGHIIYLL